MIAKQLHTIGIYIILWSMIAAALRQGEIFSYGIFGCGFLLATLPWHITRSNTIFIAPIIIPLVASHAPLNILRSFHGLLKLGIIIGIWTIALLIILQINNSTRKAPEKSKKGNKKEELT